LPGSTPGARVPPAAFASSARRRHDGRVNEQRRHPRGIVALATIVSPMRPGPVMGVVDLSESGTCLEWAMSDAVAPGTPVRLCFLLDSQAIEIDGRVVRVANGRAGVEFLPEQQDIVRQLLAQARSED
jgi:hypothetical protein